MTTLHQVNGEVWKDSDGNEIWCNGGQMLVEGGTYWWVGYETARKHPGAIRLYSSADLHTWRSHGILIAKTGEFAKFGWTGRPGLVRNASGQYVIIFEADCRDEWFRHKVGYAISDAITGPYRLANVEYPEPTRSTGDQSVYSEDGVSYLVTVLDSEGLQKPINRSLAIYRLTPDCLHTETKLFEGFDCVNDPSHRGNEALHIVRDSGTYYMLMSGLDWWNSTLTLFTSAPSLSGPWTRLRPVVTEPDSPDSFNTQHDFVIPVPADRFGTSYLYAGDRYSQFHGVGTGRNIFLPLRFEAGVPVLTWVDSFGSPRG